MRHMVQKIILVIALVAMLIPQPVQASGLEEGGGLTGMIVEHVNRRMADAIVDLVCIRHENGEVWVVAGFLVPKREGLVYVSNGPWISSHEIEDWVGRDVEVRQVIQPDPHKERLENLFARTHILFWKISKVSDCYYTERHRENAEIRREKLNKTFLRVSQ